MKNKIEKFNKLQLFLFNNEITIRDISKLLSNHEITTSIKIKNPEKFTGKEINIILKEYNKKYEELFI